MSTAGTYGYFPKIEHQNSILPQMTSDTLQPPFYFGGSQVPINIGSNAHGNGFRTKYRSVTADMKRLGVRGRGLETTYSKHHKIALPKHMKTIRQII